MYQTATELTSSPSKSIYYPKQWEIKLILNYSIGEYFKMKCMALLIHSLTYTFNLHPTVSEDYKKELLTFIGLKACVK